MRRETTLLPSATAEGLPIVFLRPFGSTSLMLPAHAGPRRDGLSMLLPARSEFLEDVATWLLWSRGEVIAVADPHRRGTRAVGAGHHRVPASKDWRDAVSRLLETAAAIVLVPGASPGVTWEIAQVLGTSEYARKALLLNPGPRSADPGFLDVVAPPEDQIAAMQEQGLVPIGAVITSAGPRLLCGSLVEDIDVEAAVEWFVRHHLPMPEDGRWDRLLAAEARLAESAQRAAAGRS
jgi:hypothetical protein